MSPQPRILVQAGSTLSRLSDVDVNGAAHDVSSDLFEGSVSVRLEGYLGKAATSQSSPTSLFHDDATFSIVIRGRFKQEINAAEVVSRRRPARLILQLTDRFSSSGETNGTALFAIRYPMEQQQH